MAIMITLWKSYTTTKDADSPVFNAQCLCFWLQTALRQLWTHILVQLTDTASWALIPDSPLRLLTPNWPHPLSSLPVLADFPGHSSFCGLCAKIDQGISRHSGATSNMLKRIPPATYNTQRPTHTSIYIYIYIYICIYTHWCSISCYMYLRLAMLLYFTL